MAPKPAPRPAEGVEFPLDADGTRSTMGINKSAIAAALRAADEQAAKDIDDIPDKKWRRAYQKGIVETVRQGAKSEKAALDMSKAGLDYLHKTMVFVRPAGADDKAISLEQAMKTLTSSKFKTHEVKGEAPRQTEFTVQYKPYGTPGALKELKGDALHRQIDTWIRTGVIESSCGVSMDKVIDNPEWLDLSDTYFVLFGATSAMGPFYRLMDLGANVIALDLDRPPIWEKLLRETRSRAGRLIFPVKEAIPAGASDADIAKVAGCNLLTDTPEIRTWLQDLYPKERLICMALAYLDGALFVKVSMAMDAIIKSLIEKRGADKMGVAYLCTPTDAHLCTPASVEAAKSNGRKAPGWQNMLAPLLGKAGMPMRKNVEKPVLGADGEPIEGLHLVDCIIPEQGPNYILAKRLQHWRAMLARSAGCIASSNVAPSTATASVLSNVMFALSYKGMSMMRPMEITYQETSNSVMAALLIRDVKDPTSSAHPKTPLKNPLCLFTENSFHGGCWRSGWKFSSLGAPALLGYVFSAFVVSPYLLFYSIYQSIGWYRILASVLMTGRSLSTWNDLGATVTFYQNLGLMEVVHAGLGMTRSSAFMTFVQIFSRIFVVAMLNECPSYFKANDTWIPIMLMCWSLADSTRYVYYAIGTLRDLLTSARGVAVAMKMMKVQSVEKADDPVFGFPFPLVWLRYSLFIVLYPLGVLGELVNITTSVGALVAAETERSSLNSISGWTFHSMRAAVSGYSTTTILGLVYTAYLFGLPALYGMLLATRKKQLAPKAPAVKKSKKTQ
eukprot:TRINITY_DN555_c1_g1_i2.p2 TRINITY_DN555_c1_g1~~TRINITY_DN555_c1_g1_i2.p2  ORF type:complete len:786 (-),score=200.35 TRINITY_DN555_c1_g1_i2:78-2435(-)